MYRGILLLSLIVGFSCRSRKPAEPSVTAPSDEIQGFELLTALMGIWEGPVVSTTVVGNFPVWKVDFRPIAPAQLSARNELDSANNIHMSFFIARYEGRPVLCLRNGGFFSGMERLTYLFPDSTAQGYYRFIEPISRGQRAYLEVFFPRSDSVVISAYTNKLRTQPAPVLHMRWTARRLDTAVAAEAADRIGYPRKVPILDLSGAFAGRQETIFYSPIVDDPYPSAVQPYLSTLHAYYAHGTGYTPQPDRYVILFTTTRPLVENMQYRPENLRYITRYVRVPATRTGFSFPHIHPGRYFLYALYDADGDGAPGSGDWFSLSGREINVPPEDTVSAQVQIDFRLP